MRNSLACLLLLACASCAVLDYPMSIFNEDGETTTAPLGDIIAASSDSVGDTVSSVVTGLTGGNGLFGVVAGAAVAAFLAGAARKKKKAAVVEEA